MTSTRPPVVEGAVVGFTPGLKPSAPVAAGVAASTARKRELWMRGDHYVNNG